MNMDLMINELLAVLEQERDLYRAMLTEIDKESKASVRLDINAMTKAGKEKEEILAKLKLIEEERLRVVGELGDASGYPSQDVTLTMISQLVEEPVARRLIEAGTELATVLSAVKNANHRNKQLFEHSQDLLRGSFNLLTELTRSDMVYYRNGNMQKTYQTGKCVNGEI